MRLWRRDKGAVAAHNVAGNRIVLKDFSGKREVPIATVTTDIAQAVRDVELIVCPAPATAQADIAKVLAPHLTDGQVVFLPPGTFGSMIVAKTAWDFGNRAGVACAETGTLPWLHAQARSVRERDHGARQRLPTGVFPLARKSARARRDRPRPFRTPSRTAATRCPAR